MIHKTGSTSNPEIQSRKNGPEVYPDRALRDHDKKCIDEFEGGSILKLNRGLLFLGMLLIAFASIGGAQHKKKPASLAFTNVRLIDGTGTAPRSEAVIVITGGRFAAVGEKEKVAIPADAEVIDAGGKTVIPGLIDAHIHMSSFAPSQYNTAIQNDAIASYRAAFRLNQLLMAGITTVRDVNSPTDVSTMAKRGYAEGVFIGSRPIVSGAGITSTGGHGSGNGRVADGEAEWRKGVREQLAAGADLIKLFPSYSREEIRAGIQEAHAHEKKAAVHSGMFKEQYDFIRWAVEEGADCIEHAYALPDDVIRMMGEKKTDCVPTVSVLLLIAENWKREHPNEPPRSKHLESIEIFRKLRQAGVRMGVGTDPVNENTLAYPGIYFDEIEWFAANGYSPMETIVAATRTNAEICDAADRLGTIEKGKLADLLVVDGDPLKDIRVLRDGIRIVVQEGRIIRRDAARSR